MVFNSVKNINRLRKEINRLLIQGMSNIYLKVSIEKNWSSQNFDVLSLKNLPPSKFFGELQLMQISLNFKTSCCNLKIRGLGAKLCVAFLVCCYFSFERNYMTFSIQRVIYIAKWKIPSTALERRTLRFSSYQNRKLKIKLWWIGTRERKKKEGMFCTIYFVQRKIFVLHVLYRNV